MSGNYQKHYSKKGLRRKFTDLIKRASKNVVRQVLTLFVMLKDPNVPKWVKVSIVGALGYLICPIDLYPDFLPCGYTDDIAIIALLLAEISIYHTMAIKAQVAELMREFQEAKIVELDDNLVIVKKE